MRDTTLGGNRFDYTWHTAADARAKVSQTNYQLQAFLVDSSLGALCDSMLIFDPNDRKISWTSYPKKKLSKLAKENIRLYTGYSDDKGDQYVVVQFVSSKEFKRTPQIYSKELFLVV